MDIDEYNGFVDEVSVRKAIDRSYCIDSFTTGGSASPVGVRVDTYFVRVVDQRPGIPTQAERASWDMPARYNNVVRRVCVDTNLAISTKETQVVHFQLVCQGAAAAGPSLRQ